jgi:ABC-type polysaccharide/polyol phosphate transport system ATPase subunit
MILVDSVSKSYDLRLQRDDYSLKESLVNSARFLHHKMTSIFTRKPSSYIDSRKPIEGFGDNGPVRRVLDNVSFSVSHGETLALVGRNGCGKSTLLKIMAGIYQPDSGSVKIEGRISPLIELGAGFHPDFTGKENVYLNGQILGLSRQQILKRYDDIVEFAEIQNYMHYPVRTYSSGMFMRLAFSVAVNADPDILLIDEILAVGDAGFQAKCHAKMDEFKALGKTIVLVSHSTQFIESWTDRAVYLRDGQMICDDHPRVAVRRYLDDMSLVSSSQQTGSVTQHSKSRRQVPQNLPGIDFSFLEQIDDIDLNRFAFDAIQGVLVFEIDLRKLAESHSLDRLKVRFLTQDHGLLLFELSYDVKELRSRLEIIGLSTLVDNAYVLELNISDSGGHEIPAASLGISFSRGMEANGLLRIPGNLFALRDLV